MAREELVSSAVTFLQDPSVSASPIDKRVAFLQSKNLTQEEIDLALARAGEDPSSAPVAQASSAPQNGAYFPQQQATYRPPSQFQGGAYGYPPYGAWQPPPPELPKRDWRDWFIMATVMGGVSYGLYFVVKRYVTPLISPPTPQQLQQDKDSIDMQFTRAFALLDQLSADTATLKSTEEERTERLDSALRDVETVVSELKHASRRREEETRRISDEVRSLKDGIPKALEGAREGSEKRLKELGAELKSLKMLMGNRLGTSTPSGSASSAPNTSRTVGGGSGAAAGGQPTSSGANTPAPRDEFSFPSSAGVNGTTAPSDSQNATVSSPLPSAASHSAFAPAAVSAAARRDGGAGNPSFPISSGGASKAAIPAWQMAAAKNAKSGSGNALASPGGGSAGEEQSGLST